MRLPLILAVALCLTGYLCSGCKTTPEGASVPDWDKLDLIGDEAISALDGQVLVWAHRPDYVETLGNVREVLVMVDSALHSVATGTSEPATLQDVLQVAISVLDSQIASTNPADQDMLAALTSVRLVLGVIRVASI